MDYRRFSRELNIRSLGEGDEEIILELCRDNPTFYKYCPPFVTVESIRADMAALPPAKTYDDKYYIGYFNSENELVAVMDFIDKYPNENTAFIGFFMMSRAFQGQGIGSRIISELCNYLKTLGYRNVRLGYADGNRQSESFWKKNGFADTGFRNKTDDYTVIILNKEL